MAIEGESATHSPHMEKRGGKSRHKESSPYRSTERQSRVCRALQTIGGRCALHLTELSDWLPDQWKIRHRLESRA